MPASPPRAVFLDPSGRRWRRVSAVVAAVLLPLLVLGGYAAWRVQRPPSLAAGQELPPALGTAETGDGLPVVGVGPMLRVLEVDRTSPTPLGRDPFTAHEVALTPGELQASADSRYVIQRYGYSATARRTISLTFDDGPDPTFTPKLLDVLAENRVPATFFVTGANAAEHPEVISRLVREGHSVGNHSLTHADISAVSDWRARQELAVTDRTLRALTRQSTRSFRLPYGGADEQSIRASTEGILRAQRLGYLLSSYDFDTLDWEHAAEPGRGEIPLPELDGSNITVLMHDGGAANRQITIDYVRDRLIPAARAAGYSFHTMPQVVPALAETTSAVDPGTDDVLTLRTAEVLFVWPDRLTEWLFLFALSSVAVVGLGNVALAVLRRHRRPRYPPVLPVLGVSVLIAAYNEEKVIARTLATLTASRYPLLELLVVDDGSRDGTSREVLAMAQRDPRIRLLRQPNAGKWAALNNGLAQLRGDFVVTLDADTVFTEDTVGNLVRQFTLEGSERLGAVAGVVRVGNRGLNLLTRWQALEYLTQIGVERAAYAQLGAIPIIPGACAAWRRTAILEAGGYSDATLAEDCDLTLSLHRAGWQVAQDDEAVAYTEAPDHVDALLAQRIRWTFGTLQAIWKHRDMLLRRRHGLLGVAVLPYLAASIIVPVLFLPFIAVMAVLAVQQQGWVMVGTYFLAFMAVHGCIAAVAVRLMHEKWHHLAVIPIYRLVYEPLRAYLLYTSAYVAVRGIRMGWNKLQRTGALDIAVSGGQLVPDDRSLDGPAGHEGPRPVAAAR